MDDVVVMQENHQKMEVENNAIVEILYKSLWGKGTMGNVTKLLASDLEWWFHGPPHCHHMMKVLTGEADHTKGFRFEPRRVAAVGGDHVIAEGWEGKAYWVHVWTLKDGLITQFREYFNTWLVVRNLRQPSWEDRKESIIFWQSQACDLYQRSLPGLVLAI
ncbi:senescence associated gene 20-like [Vigna radiata var. radiata]|uniref:Senescence associated gene 20-like n=1 Tax=Vigna radiata var. radiata TaxID=3916 RepID=A0A1S3T8U1_VIGRR|nr:senescence associated gene 20-like [Vigna radiata var. radiata]